MAVYSCYIFKVYVTLTIFLMLPVATLSITVHN